VRVVSSPPDEERDGRARAVVERERSCLEEGILMGNQLERVLTVERMEESEDRGTEEESPGFRGAM